MRRPTLICHRERRVSACDKLVIKSACACAAYPVRISMEVSHHQYEQWLLEQGKRCTDHGLHACQSPKMFGGISGVGEKRQLLSTHLFTDNPTELWPRHEDRNLSFKDGQHVSASTQCKKMPKYYRYESCNLAFDVTGRWSSFMHLPPIHRGMIEILGLTFRELLCCWSLSTVGVVHLKYGAL